MRTFALWIAIGVAAPADAGAQIWDRMTNPTFDVPVSHPPQVMLKEGQKIAVREFSGNGGLELTDRFVQALAENGRLEVVDRSNLEAILAEQGLQSSALVGRDSAVRLGELLGAGALFTGRVTRFSVEVSPVIDGGELHTKEDGKNVTKKIYRRETTVRMTASVQLVDLVTGRTHAAKMIEATATAESEGVDRAPAPPSRDEVVSAAYRDAVTQITRIVLPWTEIVQLVVYDDKKLGLDVSANQIRRGDFSAAIATLDAVVKYRPTDTKDEKYMPRVYHNLGIALMYSGKPNDALNHLIKSNGMRPTGVAKEAIDTAHRMVALQEEQVRLEREAVELGNVAPPPSEAGAARVTNQDVIDMVEAGLAEEIIITTIRTSACEFDTSPQGLIALKKGGVSDAVVKVVTEVAPAKR